MSAGKPTSKTKDGLKVSAAGTDDSDDGAAADAAGDSAAAEAYRGAHAVVMLLDPTKKWTFDYVLREAPKIPAGISILLLVS